MDTARRLARAVQELVRPFGASAPPPRTLAYLDLEHASGTGTHLLDALSTHGIFRKYERVLEIGAGLGRNARFLAARMGCEVLGTTTSPDEAAAADALTRRAGLDWQVAFLAADPAALSLRSAACTHVWLVESLPRFPDVPRTLAEALRVVRPGGWLAVQDVVLDEAGNGVTIPGWRLATAATRVAQVEGAGFVDVERRDVTAGATDLPAQAVLSRTQLLARLRATNGLEPVAAERDALAAALGRGALRVVQLLARRP